ncbi:MAG: hypothetical protein JO269_00185 [Burkholderiaceae bacterium]|nr:hypothetical protein [Burkholderiaceae bacterium]
MKRWPILVSFVLFVGLCASLTYWALQFFKPVPRAVVAPKQQLVVEVNPDAIIGLFGGHATATAAVTNFQLKGVVVSNDDKESVAILVPDGKPAVAVRVDAEAAPGVTVKEVHAKYVLLSEGGAIKRVELPANAPPMHPESPLAVQTAPQQNLAPTLPAAPPLPLPAPPPGQQTAMPSPGAGGQMPGNVAGRAGQPPGHN